MQRLSANAPLVAAIALCSLALAGCDVYVSATQAPDILLARADSPAYGPDALPGGTLEIDLDRGCVLLQGSPVVWPRGTTLTTDPLSVRFPNGRTARPARARPSERRYGPSRRHRAGTRLACSRHRARADGAVDRGRP